MSGPDDALRWEEAAAWLSAARLDRDAAVACLAVMPRLALPAAFHCQQAAEKLLKGFLVLAAQPFRKTHDMAELIDALALAEPEIALRVADMQDWTHWAVVARYPRPGGMPEPEPSEDELRRAVAAIDALAQALADRAPPGLST